MPPAVFLPEARDDIDTAYSQYESRAAGLGDRFLETLQRTVQTVEANPTLYGEVAPGIRAALLRRFPYVIYYREEPARVVVISGRHGRDDPAIWQGRLAIDPPPPP